MTFGQKVGMFLLFAAVLAFVDYALIMSGR